MRPLGISSTVAMFVSLMWPATIARAGQSASSVPRNLPAVSPAVENLPGLTPWLRPDVDAAAPPVASGVGCSLPEVLRGVGQRSQEMVSELERFAAVERVTQYERHGNGKFTRSMQHKDNYLMFVRRLGTGMLSVEESRNSHGTPDVPGASTYDNGLPGMALIFHPYFVDDFSMACEGLGEWRGHPAWQVHFVQRSDRPARMHDFVDMGKRFGVKLKGRAWITANGFQLERLDVDMAVPIPEIRLLADRITIEYRPVYFGQHDLNLWLPETVNTYLDFRGREFCNTYQFSEFQLFSVDVSQEIRAPRQPK